jgi:hypothetical protein
MYRLLSASKDTYLTDKFIGSSRSLNSNVGQAGTLDCYRLWNETKVNGTGSVNELTRLLVQFDYSELQVLTSSFLNIANSTFKAYVSLKDIYGGQTVPSNFSLRLIPLSKSWDEGRGFDVLGYRDRDSSNFLTASIAGGTVVTWSLSGASDIGTLGAVGLDAFASGNLGAGLQDLTVTQLFSRGDEDLLMDVTTLVSAAIAGQIPNHGFRISFVPAEEADTTTRFVKRFGSRHTLDSALRPRLLVTYDEHLIDYSSNPKFNIGSQDIFSYNIQNGSYVNYLSGSASITGSNSLIYELIASKSVSYYTSSWSLSHSASILAKTSSMAYLTRSYSGSQFVLNGFAQTGIYSASVNLNSVTDSAFEAYLSGVNEVKFLASWKSLDRTVTYAKEYLTFYRGQGGTNNVQEKNWVVNVTNLKQSYLQGEIARLRVFIQDYNTELVAYKFPVETKSVLVPNMKWRLIKAHSKDVIIPFSDTGTRLSSDGSGMYFDLYTADLPVNEVYEIELKITEIGRDYYVKDKGFIFKITS